MNASRPLTKGGTKERRLGKAMGWGVRLLAMSLRRETVKLGPGPESGKPRVFCFWHNRIVGAAASLLGERPALAGVVLTSASKDGAILAAAMEVFGIGAVRGSSSRRGAAALVALKRALADGKMVIITPDGPKGPCYEVQPGLVKLASLAEVPVTPVHVEYSDFWELDSWDKFRVPKPFSKVRLIFDEETHIPSDLDDTGVEEWRKKVEQRLREGFNRADDDRD